MKENNEYKLLKPYISEELYRTVIEDTGITLLDLFTIRDLLKVSDIIDENLTVILIMMFLSFNDGSLCLKIDDRFIYSRLDSFMKSKKDNIIKRFLKNLYNNQYDELIHIYKYKNDYIELLNCIEKEVYKPLILLEIGADKFLYFQKYLLNELRIKKQIIRLFKQRNTIKFDKNNVKKAVNRVLEVTKPVVLSKEQILSVILPIFNDFTIISGGPGTGKTFIVVTLLKTLLYLGVSPDRIKLAAPTGRAANRITESIHSNINQLKFNDECDKMLKTITGVTLHRLLGYMYNKNYFFYNKYNHIPADYIIIDEVSMVDVIVMSSLLEAVNDNTRLIFLGDKDQLPSVEAGRVLADLVPTDKQYSFSSHTKNILNHIYNFNALPVEEKPSIYTDKIVALTKSYRTNQKINNIAQKINSGTYNISKQLKSIDISEISDLLTNNRTDCFKVKYSNDKYIPDFFRTLDITANMFYIEKNADDSVTYMDLIKQTYNMELDELDNDSSIKLLNQIFRFLNKFKILTLLKKGIFGCDAINQHIKGLLYNKLDIKGAFNRFAGAPVLIKRNDYVKELFNGDIGVMLRDKDDIYKAVFSRFGKYISYSIDVLPYHEIAFAITVHKSQGSEYNNIFLVLPDDDKNKLLTKEIIYTAFTRAKENVMIYGRDNIIDIAVKNYIQRTSAIISK